MITWQGSCFAGTVTYLFAMHTARVFTAAFPEAYNQYQDSKDSNGPKCSIQHGACSNIRETTYVMVFMHKL